MVSRTYNTIIDAFNRLIAEKDFNKISVEMIMEKAGISRSTFYRHFKDKYDVMNANYKNLLDYFIDPAKSSNYRELCFHLFEYGQKNEKQACFSFYFYSSIVTSIPFTVIPSSAGIRIYFTPSIT